jgi:hypothetical protein
MSKDKLAMRLEVIRTESFDRVNNLFRMKVQLEDELKDTEEQIHYTRGCIDTLNKVQEEINVINEGEKIEMIKRSRIASQVPSNGGEASQ